LLSDDENGVPLKMALSNTRANAFLCETQACASLERRKKGAAG
jgi:hypothetical protein